MSSDGSGRRRFRDIFSRSRSREPPKNTITPSVSRPIYKVTNSSTPPTEQAAGPNTSLKISLDAEATRVPQERKHNESKLHQNQAEHDGPSLWALAYKELMKSDPELVKQLNYRLDARAIDLENAHLDKNNIDEVAQKALGVLEEVQDSKKNLDTVSAKLRKCFEQAIKLVDASKAFISAAASANPYAALAWSGVSLLLPLLLNHTQEEETAIQGLEIIANLMTVYRWQEKSYSVHQDFCDLAIRLYTAILEFEAKLLVFMGYSSTKKWAKDIFQAGNWSSCIATIQGLDARCRNVTNSIATNRALEWRREEQKWQEELLRKLDKLADEEGRHIREFYLNYEAFKNLNPERIEGTCEWFLSHPQFLTWRELQHSNTVWLSADPGCGKSVLAKYLVDRRGEVLTINKKPPTLCYFFFKDGDNDRNNGAKALCAFLHQLITQRPHLYKHAHTDFKNKSTEFLKDFNALWNIFLMATGDPSNHEIICVLDALDECQEHSRNTLIDSIVWLYKDSDLTNSRKPILKFLVTSRPDFNIIRRFKALTESLHEVQLRGEDESEKISHEIDLVIEHKVRELGSYMELSRRDQDQLQENLLSISHRTYLWLHLTLDNIQKKLELTKGDITNIVRTIPKNVNQAYTEILNKSPDQERARRLLHIVLAANRPLLLQEVNGAIVVDENCNSIEDINMWEPRFAENKIKNMCGLFLSVVDSRVYLIHQTAREFLTCEDQTCTSFGFSHSPGIWRDSFHPIQSNFIMTQTCIWYLQILNAETMPDVADDYFSDGSDRQRPIYKKYGLLFYAASNWVDHFRSCQNLEDSKLIEKIAFQTLNVRAKSFQIWFDIGFEYLNLGFSISRCPANAFPAAILGLDTILQRLLAEQPGQASLQDRYGRTLLWFAAYQGRNAVVKLLLGLDGVDPDVPDDLGQTPLSVAVGSGISLIQLIFEDLVSLFPRDNQGLTSSSTPTENEKLTTIQLLLEENANIDSQDNSGRTSLSYAAEYGATTTVRLLLERGARMDLQDKQGRTPLLYAVAFGTVEPICMLLQRNAQVNLPDNEGLTPLDYALKDGTEEIVKILKDHYRAHDLSLP